MKLINKNKIYLILSIFFLCAFPLIAKAEEHAKCNLRLTLVNKTDFRLSFRVPEPLGWSFLSIPSSPSYYNSRELDTDDSDTIDLCSLNYEREDDISFWADVSGSSISGIKSFGVSIRGQRDNEYIFPYADQNQYSEIIEIRYKVESNKEGWTITFFEQIDDWGAGEGVSPEVIKYLERTSKGTVEAMQGEL